MEEEEGDEADERGVVDEGVDLEGVGGWVGWVSWVEEGLETSGGWVRKWVGRWVGGWDFSD